jgi:anthranilate synthase component 1
MPGIDLATFRTLAQRGNVIRLTRRLMSDQLTPVLGYRRLVAPDERTAPSFLFESVESGSNVGRHSYIGAQPAIEVIARGPEVQIVDHLGGASQREREDDPLNVMRTITKDWRVAADHLSPHRFFAGGWVGYAAYDSVRYLERDKLPFSSAPQDDRNLPDLHFGLYRQVAVFDHVEKVLYAISHVVLEEHESIESAWRAGAEELERFVDRLETHAEVPLPPGSIDLDLTQSPQAAMTSNVSRGNFETAVRACKEYIAAGDAFQIVLSQRFERQTTADPFEIYRALRIVNPSPYMIYLQAAGSILVASSPEILCRVREGVVTNRPLAGTRRRGRSAEEDAAFELDLRNDAKERAEHVMLVDLGRNDLGRVCEVGSIALQRIMDVERFSHVMHLSSTLTGKLRAALDCWDALRNTLPAGTVSGAPKVRAMQIIDELEPTRRGPYAGGIGAVGLDGDMDIALALRTMVIPTGDRSRAAHSPLPEREGARGWVDRTDLRSAPNAIRTPHPPPDPLPQREGEMVWTIHLQAGAGIVADSILAAEYQETVNKAAALGRAIDLAEVAFGD